MSMDSQPDKTNDEKQRHRQLIEQRIAEKGNFKNFAKNSLNDEKSESPNSRYLRMNKELGRSNNTTSGVAKKVGNVGGKLSVASVAPNVAEAAATAFTEIKLGDDSIYGVIIAVSILADLFTLIPLVGSIFSIVFSIVIWVLYALSGHFKKRGASKIALILGTDLLEFLPFLDALPFFTGSAIINYWMVLAERKMKKNN